MRKLGVAAGFLAVVMMLGASFVFARGEGEADGEGKGPKKEKAEK